METSSAPAGAPPAIAVLGCGSWGANHLRVWHDIGCLRMACDVDQSRLETVRARYPGVETSTDSGDALACSDVRAVVIAAPSPTHARLALGALEAGKDVLVEKPMALALADGKHLVEVARRLKRVLMVGHVMEYHPAIRKLHALVGDGALGRLQYLYSNRLNIGRIRADEDVMWSFAPHDIAIVLRLLGTMPEEVACQGGVYLNHGNADVTLTSMRFPSGARAHIFVSWLHPFKEHRVVVVGDRQMAVFEDTGEWPGRLILYPHRVDVVDGHYRVAQTAAGEHVHLTGMEPLRAECEHFLHCILTRSEPISGGASGLDVLRILERSQDSLRSGGVPRRLRL